jgi:hypothetical protein
VAIQLGPTRALGGSLLIEPLSLGSPGQMRPTTVLHCLHVILNEEWEHQRFAVRDLKKAASAQPATAGERRL